MAAMDDHDPLSDFIQDHHDRYFYSSDANCNLPTPGDDLFSILESLDDGLLTADFNIPPSNPTPPPSAAALDEQPFVFTAPSSADQSCELIETSTSPKPKRLKLSPSVSPRTASFSDQDGRMSHITVERNRRKQMNDHLTVLRSLMPCFYVKRGDQASIIGGVVDYINELQQVLQSLEAKKQRKSYSVDVLSPRQPLSSPRPPPASAGPSPPVLSPRKPPLSPSLAAAISPRTPQPTSPYKPSASRTLILPQGPPQRLPNHTNNNYLISSPTVAATSSLEPSPTCSTASSSVNNSNSIDNLNDLFANSKSAVADVEVKFSGANVLLKTVSPPIPGQALRIISALEDLSLEILHVSITTVDDTMHNSFTIKIGIECQLSAEELALQIQQTFC